MLVAIFVCLFVFLILIVCIVSICYLTNCDGGDDKPEVDGTGIAVGMVSPEETAVKKFGLDRIEREEAKVSAV